MEMSPLLDWWEEKIGGRGVFDERERPVLMVLMASAIEPKSKAGSELMVSTASAIELKSKESMVWFLTSGVSGVKKDDGLKRGVVKVWFLESG